MIEKEILVALIQEPWIRDGKIMGLNHRDFLLFYKETDGGRPRSCILIHKTINAFMLSNYSDADNTVVRMEGITKSFTVISSYFDGDQMIPTQHIKEFVEDSEVNGKKPNYIIGADCNARCEMWGSKSNNTRGELLLDFINCHNLNICNRGSTPTFNFPSGENFEGWSDYLQILR